MSEKTPLQITIWGDYGRIERKCFMGIAQIRLDDLNFNAPVIGWYKLYHSNSLVGAPTQSQQNIAQAQQSVDVAEAPPAPVA